MEKVYSRTNGIVPEMVSGFCPGCMHGSVVKLVGEALEELDLLAFNFAQQQVGESTCT